MRRSKRADVRDCGARKGFHDRKPAVEQMPRAELRPIPSNALPEWVDDENALDLASVSHVLGVQLAAP